MKKVALLLTIAIFSTSFSGLVYGKETKQETTVGEAGGNLLQVGERNVAIKDIVLTEAAPGLFKKGKTIYLQAEHLRFEKGIKAEVTKGDIQLKEVQTDGDILKITVEKESTVPSEIKIKKIALFLESSLPDGTYSLRMITEGGENYPNNLFAHLYDSQDKSDKFSTSYVTMMENFVTLGTPKKSEEYTERLSVTVGKNEMQVNDKSIVTETPYITEGRVMLSIRAIVEALSDKATVKWDDSTKEITIIMRSRIISMKAGSKYMNLNGVLTPLQGKVELKNGRAFLPMRDLGYALQLNDSKIKWNPETMTATFN